jgi:hypothetical protein
MLLEGIGQLKNTVTLWQIKPTKFWLIKKLNGLEFVQKITPSFDIADNVLHDEFIY